MNIGDRLKSERERIGYNQTDFAAIVGASKHAQINWEKGAATPNALALLKWSEIGVDVLYVLTGQRSASQIPTGDVAANPRERVLLDNYRHLSKKGQDSIHKMLDALTERSDGSEKSA